MHNRCFSPKAQSPPPHTAVNGCRLTACTIHYGRQWPLIDMPHTLIRPTMATDRHAAHSIVGDNGVITTIALRLLTSWWPPFRGHIVVRRAPKIPYTEKSHIYNIHLYGSICPLTWIIPFQGTQRALKGAKTTVYLTAQRRTARGWVPPLVVGVRDAP